MNDISKSDNPANNGTSELKYGSPDGGDDGDYNGVGLVDISRTFATQKAFFFAMKKFDRICPASNSTFML